MDVIYLSIAIGFLSVAVVMNSLSIRNLNKRILINARLIADIAELLAKISKTRWGIHD